MNTVQDRLSSLARECEQLTVLLQEFPDLKIHKNRWGQERYYSKWANTLADRADISHNCGCCNDSPLEVWPYTVRGEFRVYSDPPYFRVGEKVRHAAFEDRPYEGWENALREANIRESVISLVAARLVTHASVFTEEEEK